MSSPTGIYRFFYRPARGSRAYDTTKKGQVSQENYNLWGKKSNRIDPNDKSHLALFSHWSQAEFGVIGVLVGKNALFSEWNSRKISLR